MLLKCITIFLSIKIAYLFLNKIKNKLIAK